MVIRYPHGSRVRDIVGGLRRSVHQIERGEFVRSWEIIPASVLTIGLHQPEAEAETLVFTDASRICLEHLALTTH